MAVLFFAEVVFLMIAAGAIVGLVCSIPVLLFSRAHKPSTKHE